MLHVDLDNILTHDELAARADEVLRKADEENKIMVITRNGRPAVAIVKLEELEKLSGKTVHSDTPPPITPGHGADVHMIPPDYTAAPLAAPSTPASSETSTPMPNPSGLPEMPDNV